jgi:hypothetical protein
MPVTFPSLPFFEALQREMRAERDRFARLGFFDTTFVVEGPFSAWRAMLDAIHALGAADTVHSLNTLTHFGDRLRVRYDDPDGHDKMYRFAQSIQELLDLSARIDFRYPDGGSPPARAEPLRRIGT